MARAALALAGLMIPGAPASADELVKFTSAGRADPIQGYLTKPKGAGPFPAVVLLHTCLGLPANRRSIGDSLAAWGYVALFVDDFGARGLKETCTVDFPQGVADAYGALGFLAGSPLSTRRESPRSAPRKAATPRSSRGFPQRLGRAGVQGGGGLLSPMRK